jgi:hypothetical protein
LDAVAAKANLSRGRLQTAPQAEPHRSVCLHLENRVGPDYRYRPLDRTIPNLSIAPKPDRSDSLHTPDPSPPMT